MGGHLRGRKLRGRVGSPRSVVAAVGVLAHSGDPVGEGCEVTSPVRRSLGVVRWVRRKVRTDGDADEGRSGTREKEKVPLTLACPKSMHSGVARSLLGRSAAHDDIVAARTSASTLRYSTHATEKAITLGCVIGALTLKDAAIERVGRDASHTEQFEAREEMERIHFKMDVEFHLERS